LYTRLSQITNLRMSIQCVLTYIHVIFVQKNLKDKKKRLYKLRKYIYPKIVFFRKSYMFKENLNLLWILVCLKLKVDCSLFLVLFSLDIM